MDREEKAIFEHLFAIGHLQGTVSLGSKREKIRITNVSTPRHLIQQAIRKNQLQIMQMLRTFSKTPGSIPCFCDSHPSLVLRQLV
jgi:hypothetical protein